MRGLKRAARSFFKALRMYAQPRASLYTRDDTELAYIIVAGLKSAGKYILMTTLAPVNRTIYIDERLRERITSGDD